MLEGMQQSWIGIGIEEIQFFAVLRTENGMEIRWGLDCQRAGNRPGRRWDRHRKKSKFFAALRAENGMALHWRLIGLKRPSNRPGLKQEWP